MDDYLVAQPEGTLDALAASADLWVLLDARCP